MIRHASLRVPLCSLLHLPFAVVEIRLRTCGRQPGAIDQRQNHDLTGFAGDQVEHWRRGICLRGDITFLKTHYRPRLRANDAGPPPVPGCDKYQPKILPIDCRHIADSSIVFRTDVSIGSRAQSHSENLWGSPEELPDGSVYFAGRACGTCWAASNVHFASRKRRQAAQAPNVDTAWPGAPRRRGTADHQDGTGAIPGWRPKRCRQQSPDGHRGVPRVQSPIRGFRTAYEKTRAWEVQVPAL